MPPDCNRLARFRHQVGSSRWSSPTRPNRTFASLDRRLMLRGGGPLSELVSGLVGVFYMALRPIAA
jgi:hypothetical protein